MSESQHRESSPTGDLAAELPPGMSEDAFREAVLTSGYPLQIRVGDALNGRDFHLVEEWAYLDPDSGERRAVDVLAHRPIGHPFESSEGRSQVSLALMIECKQSRHPLTFFESVSPPSLDNFPQVVGLRGGEMNINPEGDENWSKTVSLMEFLGAGSEPFVATPPIVASMSRATPNGSKVRMSGDEPYRSLTMPLTKAMTQYASYWRSLSNRRDPFRPFRILLGIAIVDAPMVIVGLPGDAPEMRAASWVRLIVREGVPAERDVWKPIGFQVLDVVHWRFFARYLDDSLLPFASEIRARSEEALDAVLADHPAIQGLERGKHGPSPLYKHVVQ